MLKLRPEHLEAFERRAINLFTERLTEHVHEVWAKECSELGDAAVQALLQNDIQRAARFGLMLEYDVVRFVDLSFILANDFEKNPQAAWTNPILTDPGLSPTAKMDRIYQQIEQELSRRENRKSPQL